MSEEAGRWKGDWMSEGAERSRWRAGQGWKVKPSSDQRLPDSVAET